LGKTVLKVGVFVDEEPGIVKKIARDCGLDILQFHGDETLSYLKEFKAYKTIKALRIKDKRSLTQIPLYRTDYFLLDTFKKGLHGGTGKAFDWKLLKSVGKLRNRLFISGGLTPDNVGELLKKFKPFAVDVSSGVERCPGKKDIFLVSKFLKKAKEA
jgi:phosphoribosylanthranilate isomerase